MKKNIKIEFTCDEYYIQPVLYGGAAWVAELKSGKYNPTAYTLCRLYDGKKKYCCIGVKCEMDKILLPKHDINGGISYVAKCDYRESGDTLPENHPWALDNGIEMQLPHGFRLFLIAEGRKNEVPRLSTLNDSLIRIECNDDNVFRLIASVIEAAWHCE